MIVMTYNLLAESLYNPDDYPYSNLQNEAISRTELLLKRISKVMPDILCVQELNWDVLGDKILSLGYIEYNVEVKSKQTPGNYFAKGSKFGNAIFIKKDSEGKRKIISHEYVIYDICNENKGKLGWHSFIVINALIDDNNYTIINTHLKARDTEEFRLVRKSQANQLFNYANKIENESKPKVIICGDFNDFPNFINDNVVNNVINNVINKVINKDNKMKCAVNMDLFTLMLHKPNYLILRLFVDYIFVSQGMETEDISEDVNYVIPCKDEPSDHLPRIVRIK